MIDSALKEIEWERAKGHLPALAAIQGSYSGGDQMERYEQVRGAIEKIIKEFEGEGLHE